MRILIFGETMLPPAYLPRVRYFCSYFIEKGWEVDWIVETSDYMDYFPDGVSLLAIDYYKFKKGFSSKIEWIFKFLLNLIWDYKGRFFFKNSQHFIANKHYDVVFCSSCFTFPLTTAARVAKKMNIPLFVDLRDIAEQSPDDHHYLAQKPPKLLGNFIINSYKKINIKRRNNVLNIATGVTTVSPWHVQTLSKNNPRTYLIYNGFDENKFLPENIKTERFTISYFGRIYNEEMRNPNLLFEAIQQLNEKKILTPQNTAINWFVDRDSMNIIQKITHRYKLDDFTHYFDFIEPDKLSDEMNRSSVMLVLGNGIVNKRYFGIMTTKLFEAFGTNRPVLCIPDNSDNLSEIVKKTHCGLVSSDANEVEKFLLAVFLEWQKKGSTAGTLSEELRMTFSRKKGAEILEKIVNDALKKQ